jgi:hypothetical protein
VPLEHEILPGEADVKAAIRTTMEASR